MDRATHALVALSAAIAARDRFRLIAAMRAAADAAESRAVEEALLQSHLFVGYPAALNALALWRDQFAPEPATPMETNEVDWWGRGEEVCAAVYAGQYDRLRSNVARLHPEFERWMLTEGYGKVLGRPGLPLAVRELCIVGLLVPQDAAPQLHAHLRGALNVGASVDDVEEAVGVAASACDAERGVAARSVWREVRQRWVSR